VLEGIITKEQKEKKSLKNYIPKLNRQEIQKVSWMNLIRKVREILKKKEGLSNCEYYKLQ